jgi:hypothetical protein
MTYRAAVHETTKVAPYEMMFGRTINLPIDLVIGHPDSNNIVPEYSSGYVFSYFVALNLSFWFCVNLKVYTFL